jgi:hypothetical protein
LRPAPADQPDAWQSLFITEAGVAVCLPGCGSSQVGIHLRAVHGRVGPSPSVLIGRIGLAQAALLSRSRLLGYRCCWELAGLYWLVPGIVQCLVVALLDA